MKSIPEVLAGGCRCPSCLEKIDYLRNLRGNVECPKCGGVKYVIYPDFPPDYYLPRCIKDKTVMIRKGVLHG